MFCFLNTASKAQNNGSFVRMKFFGLTTISLLTSSLTDGTLPKIDILFCCDVRSLLFLLIVDISDDSEDVDLPKMQLKYMFTSSYKAVDLCGNMGLLVFTKYTEICQMLCCYNPGFVISGLPNCPRQPKFSLGN